MTDLHVEMLKRSTLLVTCPRGWEREARQELRRMLPGATVESLYIGGNIIVQFDEDAGEALRRISDTKTWTIAHVTPVQMRMPIGPGREWLERMQQAAARLGAADTERSFMVAVDRRGDHHFSSHDVVMAVADAFVEGGKPPVDLETPEQVCSVEIFQDLCYMGMNPAEHLLRKELRRMRLWAPGGRPISRAELKLREAIRQFELELPEGARALDLGAAPGGWTRVLAEHAAEVVAVDPGDLDERVESLPNVTHLRCRTEELDPAQIGHFDLLVNDMNMEPQRSAELMCEMAPLLQPGAVAVMTIKFTTRQRSRHIREALAVLERCYGEIEVLRMPHNAKETTAVMRLSEEAQDASV